LLVTSLLMTASLAATALFFALALLPLPFLFLAIFVLAALLSGTTVRPLESIAETIPKGK
jgi:hypothetical protein